MMELAKDMVERLLKEAHEYAVKCAGTWESKSYPSEAGYLIGTVRLLCYEIEARNREINDLLAEIKGLREGIAGREYAQDQIADHLTVDL